MTDRIVPYSRSDAVEIGAERYFTGKPCPYGHVGHRYTSNSRCVRCRAKGKLLMPTDRSIAKERGTTTYFTGQPCHAGHLSERYTRNACCVTCAIEQNRSRYAQRVEVDSGEAARLYCSGLLMREVAEILNTSTWFIGKALESKGVKPRKNGIEATRVSSRPPGHRKTEEEIAAAYAGARYEDVKFIKRLSGEATQ